MLMAVEENRAAVEGIIDAAFNRKDAEAARAYLAPGYVEHRFMPGQPNADFWGYAVQTLRRAFPDYRFTIHRVVAEGENVTVYGSGSGTHRGDLVGIPPTFKHVIWEEVHIARLVDGKLIEHWVVADNLALMQQLGLLPAPGSMMERSMNALAGAVIRLMTWRKRRSGAA
jgi:predicted ester cyclase